MALAEVAPLGMGLQLQLLDELIHPRELRHTYTVD